MDAPLFLANLEKRREKKAITVRVVRKWTRIDNQGQGDPLYVGMVFTDAQGGAIYAEIPGKVVSLKEYLLDLGKVYNIKKFTVMNAKPNYKVVQGQLMIELSEFTTIELVRDPPPTIPEYCYSLSNFTSIVPPDGPLNQYTDVIGYVTKYTNLDTFVPKNKEDPVMLREIYIKDLRDNELKITIWGEHAVNFNLDHVYDRDVGNIVVCLLVGCTPHREYRDYNKIYLSGSTPFSYYLNPQIPDAAPYYSRFKDVSVLIDCPFAAQDIVPAQVQSVPRQMKTVADMNAIVDPFEFEDGTYKCQVTITSVVENMKWWYMSCRICKTKTIQQADRSYRCMNCNGTKVVARYLLSFWAKDDTAEGRFFAHDAEAKIIIGVDCESIMNPLGLAGNLPSQLLNIVNKKYTFSIDLDSGAIRQYVVKAVLEKPSKRPAQASGSTLMLQGSASHNAGASSSVIHIRSAHAEPAAPTEKTLTTPPPLAIQMTSAPVEAVDDTLENASIRYRRGTTARKNLAFPDNVQKEKDSSDQHASTNEETPSDDDHTNIVSGAETRSKRVRLSTAKGEPKQKNQKSAPSAPST